MTPSKNIYTSYCRRHLGEDMPLMEVAGFPSVVDRERRRLYSSTNFPGLDGVDIVEELTKQLGIPVIIDHDAYYLLVYDILDYKIPDQGAVLGFYFGTGIGNTIYLGLCREKWYCSRSWAYSCFKYRYF